MPTKTKTQKKLSSKKKKSLKRKAVSPQQGSGVNAILSTDQACIGVVDSQAGSVYNNN